MPVCKTLRRALQGAVLQLGMGRPAEGGQRRILRGGPARARLAAPPQDRAEDSPLRVGRLRQQGPGLLLHPRDVVRGAVARGCGRGQAAGCDDAEGLEKPECVAMPEEMSLIACNYPMVSRLEHVKLQQQEEDKAKAALQAVPSPCVKQEPGSAEGDTINVRQRPKPVESQEGIQEQDSDTITVTPSTSSYPMRGERGGAVPSQRDEDNATPDIPVLRERTRRRREDLASSSPKRRRLSSVLAPPAGNDCGMYVRVSRTHIQCSASRRAEHVSSFVRHRVRLRVRIHCPGPDSRRPSNSPSSVTPRSKDGGFVN
jgi:hypothetical protein